MEVLVCPIHAKIPSRIWRPFKQNDYHKCGVTAPSSALGSVPCTVPADSLLSAPHSVAQSSHIVWRWQSRGLIQPGAAKGQACEETHLVINIRADTAVCVYTGHWNEHCNKYCSFIAPSNRRSSSARSWLGCFPQVITVLSIIKENIISYSEIIISYSETCILTLTFVSQPCFCEKPQEKQNPR